MIRIKKVCFFIFLLIIIFLPIRFIYAGNQLFEDNVLTEYFSILPTDEFEKNENIGVFFELTGYENIREVFDAVINGEFKFSLKQLLNDVTYLIKQYVSTGVSLLASIVAVCLLSVVISGLSGGNISEKVNKAVFAVVYYALVYILCEVLNGVQSNSLSLSLKISAFSSEVIPVLLFILSVGGGVITYTVLSPTVLIFIQIFIFVISEILIPLCMFGFVLCVIQNISESINLGYLEKLIAKVSSFIVKAISFLFAMLITFEGITLTGADGLKAQSLKFIIKSLPVAGSFLGESIDTIRSISTLIQNTFGLIGVLSVVCVFIFPLLNILLIYLTLELSAVIVQPFTDKRIHTCVECAADYLYRMFAYSAMLTVMLIVAVGIITMFANYLFMFRT